MTRGQSLALVAIAFVILLLFIGLLTDVGILYATYGQLKRAVDAAAVSAATKYRVTGDRALLENYAQQTIEANGVSTLTMHLYLCDNNDDSLNDDPAALPSGLTPPTGVTQSEFESQFDFYCPTGATAERKYVMVYAQQNTPIYFMRLIGWETFPLTTNAISEAASLDIVLVIDSSSSMAQTPCDDPTITNGSDGNPKVCDTVTTSATYDAPNDGAEYIGDNSAYAQVCNLEPSIGGVIDSDSDGVKACYPFYKVKDAANTFISKLNFPYDRVALVSFHGESQSTTGSYTNGVGDSSTHPFSAGVIQPFTSSQTSASAWVNGNLADGELPASYRDQGYVSEFGGWSPNTMSSFCSNPASFYDATGTYFNSWDDIASAVTRYCVDSNVGGGVRVATELFKQFGRQTSVWVMVFLTDGFTNLSDLPDTNGISSLDYPYGFCRGPHGTIDGTTATLVNSPYFPDGWYMVRPLCSDNRILTRYCADENGGFTTDTPARPTCPPAVYGTGAYKMTVSYDQTRYNVEDYARDMADEAALQVLCPTIRTSTEQCVRDADDYYNAYESLGEQVTIYAVGIGSGITNTSTSILDDDAYLTPAAAMLRYFAAVGDDGDRVTDQCLDSSGVPYAVGTSCGNYYYAPNAFQLSQIFEAIASKIYTRLSQ